MSRPPMSKAVSNTGEMVALLVERSAPDPVRPRLTDERERRLASVETQSANCYANAELLALKLRRLATNIDDAPEEEPAAEAVPEEREDEPDSVVIHLDTLRAQTKIE